MHKLAFFNIVNSEKTLLLRACSHWPNSYGNREDWYSCDCPMRGFYKLPQGLKLGKNSDGKVKYAQIRIFKDSQLWKQNLWGACPHLSSSQGHSEDWESNGGPVRDMYSLPDKLKRRPKLWYWDQNCTKLAFLKVVNSEKNTSFGGLFPMIQQLRS